MNPLALIDMKSKLNKNSNQNRNVNVNTNVYKVNTANQFTASNLTQIEERIIKEIIHGELTAENASVANTAISLEDAVKKIRNGR